MERERVRAAHELDLALVLALAQCAHRAGYCGVGGAPTAGAEAVGDKGAHGAVNHQHAVAPDVVHEHVVWRLALGPRDPGHMLGDFGGHSALTRARLLKRRGEDYCLVRGRGDGDEEGPLRLRPAAGAKRAEEVFNARARLGHPHGRVLGPVERVDQLAQARSEHSLRGREEVDAPLPQVWVEGRDLDPAVDDLSWRVRSRRVRQVWLPPWFGSDVTRK